MVRLGRVVERGAPDTGVKGEAEDSKLPRIGALCEREKKNTTH